MDRLVSKRAVPPDPPDPKRRKRGPGAKRELLGKQRSDPFTIRKVKLNTALRLPALRQPILEQVDAFAKLSHEASLLANLTADLAIRNGRHDELPATASALKGFFQHCLKAVRDYPNVVEQGRSTLPAILLDTLRQHWSKSSSTYAKPMGNFMAPVSTEMGTNAHNHIFVHYYDRQLRGLKRAEATEAQLLEARQACRKKNPSAAAVRNKLAEMRQKHINAPEYDGEDPVVLHHRSLLLRDEGVKVDHRWLKKNAGRALVYLRFLGQVEHDAARQHEAYHRAHGRTPPGYLKARTFTLYPIRGYSRHSLPIEANGLFGLMNQAGLLQEGFEPTDMTQHQLAMFDMCFDFDRFAKTGRRHKACRVTTDGTSCSLSYFIPGGKSRSKGSKKKKAAEIPYKDRVDLATVERGLFTDKNCRLDSLDGVTVVGADTGRYSLVTFGDGHSFLHYGKKEHYDRCFYQRGTQARRRWNDKARADLKAAIAASAQQSFVIGEDLVAAWRARAPLEAKLWAHYGTSEWRNLRFKQWSRKQAAYSRLVARLRAQFGRDAVIAFGAAKFAVTAVGDVSGPLVEMARELSRHFRVVYTDEFRSSACCFTCSVKTSDVRRDQEQGGAEGRSTVFCIRRCVQCRRYRNRDRNAALNIREFLCRRLVCGEVRFNFRRTTGPNELRPVPTYIQGW